MKATSAALFVAASLLLTAACSAPPAPASAPQEGASTGPSAPSAPSAPEVGPAPSPLPIVAFPAASPIVAGTTAAGQVALFDVDTGAVLSQAASAGLGGEVDIACDPWHDRILAFEGEEGQWGEIADYPVTDSGGGPALGARVHQVWVDGVAAVAASPFGVIEMQDGYGPQWTLLPGAGAPLPSVYGPRPASIDLGLSASGDFEMRALTYGPDDASLDLRSAVVSQAGIGPVAISALPAPPAADWPSARRARAEGRDFLVSTASGDLALSVSDGGGFSPYAAAGAGPAVRRIESAAALDKGRLAALVSSDAGGPDLVVVKVGDNGSALCEASIDLPGAPRRALLFFSRDLLIAGSSRLLAATSSGVFAVSVSSGCPLTLEIDPAFAGDALRGPLDLCDFSF